MQNYVVTGFNEEYWHFWGVSWLVSLKEFAKHNPGQTIVVAYDLPVSIKNKIIETGVILIPHQFSDDIRSSTIQVILDLAKKESALFAYWDADVFFQDQINEIFDLGKNDLLVSKKPGFIAGSSQKWLYLEEVLNIMSLTHDTSNVHDCLLAHFDKLISIVDDTWNFTEVPYLKDIDGYLAFKGIPQKVIHPSGEIKRMLINRNILFWERHKDLFSRSLERKKINFRKLISKSATH